SCLALVRLCRALAVVSDRTGEAGPIDPGARADLGKNLKSAFDRRRDLLLPFQIVCQDNAVGKAGRGMRQPLSLAQHVIATTTSGHETIDGEPVAAVFLKWLAPYQELDQSLARGPA